ncbi:YbhB/YbcL family Raf kinase inhibitor-like protein [Pyrococcus kukulkanii]|uniref:YbhB/YbcL family Raf kinase inhibitor-like protein n=1 Tax=Pyrococcus kukulkanii TaxID=1609559 RepID=UPI003562D36E
MKKAVFLILLLPIILLSGCLEEKSSLKFSISSVFQEDSPIPKKYTCDGININPPLYISNIPENAKSLAIIVDDPDAPGGTFTHWIAWNIPPVKEIPEGIPKKGKVESPVKMIQGINDFGRIGYDGPCPPPGHGVHHYHFKVYALDITLNLTPRSTRRDLEEAMKGHIIAEAELVGTYER